MFCGSAILMVEMYAFFVFVSLLYSSDAGCHAVNVSVTVDVKKRQKVFGSWRILLYLYDPGQIWLCFYLLNPKDLKVEVSSEKS